MILAQANMFIGMLLTYGVIILVVVAVLVAILRWALQINDIIKHQEEILKLLHEIVRQR